MTGAVLAFWIILPYAALAIFFAGHAWRWRHDQFGWTSLSTQLQERRLLLWGSPLFHYGSLAAIAGHVLGILIPEPWTAAIGITEDFYRVLSAVGGAIAGAAVVIGLVILLYRRITVRRVAVTTSRVDIVVYVLLFVVIGLGMAETVGVNLVGRGYDYRLTVAVWFRGLFVANPQPGLMATAPLLYQVHAICAWFLLALWPFSRLVHAWSYPVLYLGRPWILYRGYRTAARSHSVPLTARARR